ncbi:MAG TPA: thioredoxin domain-containing protein [Dongiaceae bacterium]|nr:thioredoxin domain-containing protein [Dongiaceae bacterium]
MTEERNRLDRATSPYLLQHRHNPVHWQMWSQEAFDLARRTERPILLSVGYAACHWCHVMAHESFEDPEIAAVMNRLFVNIKLDREERPDLDAIYQQALALLGQQGGWPLTMFLDHEGKPFWGGTYFPKQARWGRPAFIEVLQTLARLYREEPDRIRQNRGQIMDALARLSASADGPPLPKEQITVLAEHLCRATDPVNGGFGTAPKFPHVPNLELLWRVGARAKDAASRERFHAPVLRAIRAMCQGGIYDHLGGGMARYATDAQWLIPHFEKMLYDNAALLDLLAMVAPWVSTPLLSARATEIVTFLDRDMRAGGGLAASWDADSEGEEGKYYVWDQAEIVRVLNADADFFAAHYGVSATGNWEGKNILNRLAVPEWQGEEVENRLAALRARLLAVRAQRPSPGFDDKVLLDWNAMAVAALARAGLVFQRPDWIARAEEIFDFLAAHLRDGERWFHSWRHGKTGAGALLEDHAHFAAAALVLHEITGDETHLVQAVAQAEILDRDFWDEKGGGYFTTSRHAADVILRHKTCFDGAIPNGNGIMLGVLVRLWLLCGEDAYQDRAERLERAFAAQVQSDVFSLGTYLNNVDLLRDPWLVTLAMDKAQSAAFDAVLARQMTPFLIVQRCATGVPAGHPAAGRGSDAAFLCRGQSCSLPLTSPEALESALGDAYTEKGGNGNEPA